MRLLRPGLHFDPFQIPGNTICLVDAFGDIQKIWATRKKTIVFVTHNVREAACLGNRVILFSSHRGRIREEFKIDLERP